MYSVNLKPVPVPCSRSKDSMVSSSPPVAAHNRHRTVAQAVNLVQSARLVAEGIRNMSEPASIK